jgi:hypothetical protein
MSRGAVDEARLRELLRATPVPGAAEAERRGLAMVEAAFAERARATDSRRPSLPRLAIALAAAALLAALLLSPAGAAVRHWIGDVFEPGMRNAEPALTRVPGGGRLAVASPAGPWVVQPGGARRLLGDYREATWSPHGLYLAAVSGRTLTAVEPDGDPHWSITAPGDVADPRWSPSGFRIAYRAGRALRVVHADGTGDRLLATRVEPVAPAWSPGGLHELAYVDGSGRMVVVDADSGQRLTTAGALKGVAQLEWGLGGVVIESSSRAVRARRVVLDKITGDVRLAPPHLLRIPGGGRVIAVVLSPQAVCEQAHGCGPILALLRQLGGGTQVRAEVDLIDLRTDSLRRLFRTPGRLGQIVWSPRSDRLLITWPEADQWLFVPISGRGRVTAVSDLSRQFNPGAASTSRFPSISGWCCSANP